MQDEDSQIFKCQRVRGRTEGRPRQESVSHPAAVYDCLLERQDFDETSQKAQARKDRTGSEVRSTGRDTLRVAGVGRLMGGGRNTTEGKDRSRVLTRGSDFGSLAAAFGSQVSPRPVHLHPCRLHPAVGKRSEIERAKPRGQVRGREP